MNPSSVVPNTRLQRRTTDENRVLFSNLNEFVVRIRIFFFIYNPLLFFQRPPFPPSSLWSVSSTSLFIVTTVTLTLTLTLILI